jgi:hypothetical protein
VITKHHPQLLDIKSPHFCFLLKLLRDIWHLQGTALCCLLLECDLRGCGYPSQVRPQDIGLLNRLSGRVEVGHGYYGVL